MENSNGRESFLWSMKISVITTSMGISTAAVDALTAITSFDDPIALLLQDPS